eukprot:6606529-Pyramimonas_sp.AAC.2
MDITRDGEREALEGGAARRGCNPSRQGTIWILREVEKERHSRNMLIPRRRADCPGGPPLDPLWTPSGPPLDPQMSGGLTRGVGEEVHGSSGAGVEDGSRQSHISGAVRPFSLPADQTKAERAHPTAII